MGYDLNQQMGDYQIVGTSIREYNMQNDIFTNFAQEYVTNLDDLANLFVSQGLLQEGFNAEMELERQKFLSQIPEDDPLREQKADYLVLHTDGAFAEHMNLKNASTNVADIFDDLPRDGYQEFSERYHNQTGKNISEMSLKEFADQLEIPEEK